MENGEGSTKEKIKLMTREECGPPAEKHREREIANCIPISPSGEHLRYKIDGNDVEREGRSRNLGL